MSGVDLIDFETLEASGEDGNEGDLDKGDEMLLGPVEDSVQSAVAAEPDEGAFNGLITNDKFCLTRIGRLQLNLSRVRSEPRASKLPQLFGEATHRGGEHAAAKAAPLANSAHWCVDTNQPAALGPGLPAPPAVGDDESTGADKGAGIP